MRYFVYLLYNVENDKFYIGQTNDLKRRLFEHNEKDKQKYTSKYKGNWVLVCKEDFFDRSEAKKRENFLKKQRNKEFYKRLCRESVSVD